MDQVLELKNIHYAYHNPDGETPAINGISFILNKGEFVAIVGPSGCGKSTLLSIIAGLLIPEKGFIKINGKYLHESTTNVGYMLQHDELFEWRTIYNNVILGLEIQHMLTARTREKAHNLLDIYGLKQFENARPSELSGGMQQRLQIARNLVTTPRLVFMDEPTGGLDVSVQARLLDLLRHLVRDMGLAVVLVTHDLAVARLLSHRLIVMYHGEVAETGLTDQVLDDPQHPYSQLLVSSILQC